MGGMNLSTGYLLGCMRSKFLRRKRILTLIFLGMLIAALGVIIVASVARNRELQTPWYAQRSAKIVFQQPVSPAEAYNALHAEYAAGTINGYALIADADTSGGIALGGQEGALDSGNTAIILDVLLSLVHPQSILQKRGCACKKSSCRIFARIVSSSSEFKINSIPTFIR